MIFFDKMYVGFQRDRYNKSEDARILGFAVPFDNTKASKNKQQTVERWRQKDIEPRIFDNKPTRGFKLTEVVSRYSTSNKLFRVIDPRGFELEISADNLLDIAMESTIVKGEIIEECVWSSAGKIYLCPVSNPLYKQHTTTKVSGAVKVVPENYYTVAGNAVSVFRFEGIYHKTYLGVKHNATKADVKLCVTPQDSIWNNRYYDVLVKEYTTKVEIQGSKTPSYLYTEFILDADGNVQRYVIHERKSHFKNLIVYQNPTYDMTKTKLDMTQWSDVPNLHAGMKDTKDTLTTNSYSGGYTMFFKTKIEAQEFDYTDIISNIKPGTQYYNKIDVSNIVNLYNTNSFATTYASYGSNRCDVSYSNDVKQIFNIIDKRKE